MNSTHEVISAFLDDEPFEPRALGDALADRSGRDFLLDLIALRHLTQADEGLSKAAVRPTPSRFRLVIATAAVIVALIGGYQLGQKQATAALTRPPEATRVVPAAAAWLPAGGGR
jgi:hypothetical protein